MIDSLNLQLEFKEEDSLSQKEISSERKEDLSNQRLELKLDSLFQEQKEMLNKV